MVRLLLQKSLAWPTVLLKDCFQTFPDINVDLGRTVGTKLVFQNDVDNKHFVELPADTARQISHQVCRCAKVLGHPLQAGAQHLKHAVALGARLDTILVRNLVGEPTDFSSIAFASGLDLVENVVC